MTFSTRVPPDLAPNRLTHALARLREERRPVLDLTESNPTRAGFSYPPDLLAPLAHARGLTYAPEPLGLLDARRAVADDFLRRGHDVSVDRLALTASTSEAYSLLFKVLCSPGDEVLVPRPSYPLFEHLTRFESVVAVPYDLEYHGTWAIDLSALERRFGPRTRALLLVSPNNPTGNFASRNELDALAAMCQRHGAAVIADEVFADYELTEGASARAGRLLDRDDVLGFSLGGLSKSVGLPQLKLAWIALSGGADARRDARARLELLCDTYLSVSTPVQLAARDLLTAGAPVREAIQQRVIENYRTLKAHATLAPACDVLNADGGWYAVMRVPSLMSEEDLVLSLLTDDHVLVHPGYFFDFPTESFLVVSLLTRERTLTEGIRRVLRRFATRAGAA